MRLAFWRKKQLPYHLKSELTAACREQNDFRDVAPGVWCLDPTFGHNWGKVVPPWIARCEWVTWDEYCDAYDGYTTERQDCLHGTDLLFREPWQEYARKYDLMIDATWHPDRERWMLLRHTEAAVPYAERTRMPMVHSWIPRVTLQ